MPEWVECILRLLLAIGLGFVIGVERQLRLRVAGIRTHAIVSAGACLFVIVSIYGFKDFSSDASRIAAQIVSGIGFIGAGMILHRQNAVRGLTSAAGIWLTAAIGMLAGAGLYIVASCSTAIIIIVQLLMHLPLKLLKEKHYSEVNIIFKNTDGQHEKEIKALFETNKFTEFKADRRDGEVIFTAVIQTKKQIDDEFITKTIDENPYILSISKMQSDT